MELDNLKKTLQKDVLDVLSTYILAFILSKLISNLFEDILAFFTNLSLSSLSDNESKVILTIIYIIKNTYYLIL